MSNLKIKKKIRTVENFDGNIALRKVKVVSKPNPGSEDGGEEARKAGLNKLAQIFKFNIYCGKEISAMVSNYRFPIDARISKKLKFYEEANVQAENNTMEAASINSVISVADCFELNTILSDMEFNLLKSTVREVYGVSFSIKRPVLKSFILENIHDEEGFCDIVFNLNERVRLVYLYIFRSRKARKGLI